MHLKKKENKKKKKKSEMGGNPEASQIKYIPNKKVNLALFTHLIANTTIHIYIYICFYLLLALICQDGIDFVGRKEEQEEREKMPFFLREIFHHFKHTKQNQSSVYGCFFFMLLPLLFGVFLFFIEFVIFYVL